MWGRIKRIFKHGWFDDASTQRVIAPDVLARLAQRVTDSERRHSGELRIYVEAGLPLSYLWSDAPTRQITRERALDVFSELGVWNTAHNNGVLIYLLLAEQVIEVVADRGLNDLIEPQVWQSLVSSMGAEFRQGYFEEGLTHALDEVSALLVRHFPLTAGQVNPNELPDAPHLR